MDYYLIFTFFGGISEDSGPLPPSKSFKTYNFCSTENQFGWCDLQKVDIFCTYQCKLVLGKER